MCMFWSNIWSNSIDSYLKSRSINIDPCFMRVQMRLMEIDRSTIRSCSPLSLLVFALLQAKLGFVLIDFISCFTFYLYVSEERERERNDKCPLWSSLVHVDQTTDSIKRTTTTIDQLLVSWVKMNCSVSPISEDEKWICIHLCHRSSLDVVLIQWMNERMNEWMNARQCNGTVRRRDR